MKLINLTRRTICYTMAVLMVCSCVLGAAANKYGDSRSIVDGGDIELSTEYIVYNSPSQYGYSDYIIIDENGETVAEECASAHQNALDEDVMSGDYDEKYDAREYGIISDAKYQGTSGACWAFSAISCMETSMAKQTLDEQICDYSEAHLVYFTYNGLTPDESSSIYGDGLYHSSPFTQGGNWIKAVGTLSRGSGAELEQYAPFNADDFNSMVFDEQIRNESYAGIKNAIKIDGNDKNAVKQAIMDYGSISMAYYSDNNHYKTANGQKNYYRGVDDNISANHGVVIIGWDDNYSKENFAEANRPTTDGAWLIKNSWGDKWSDNGCFWMSYKEPSMKTFVCYQAQDISEYDNIYLYDGAGYNSIASITNHKSISMANIFTSEKNETLEAISLYIVQNDQDYKLDIYTDVKITPDDGNLVLSKSGSINDQGYYTIDLDDEVELKAGQRFSVVITVTARNDSTAKIAVEGPSSGIYNYSSEKGVSFIKPLNSTVWSDTRASNLNNVCIKAFTTGIDKTELLSAINKAEQYKKEDYTASSWKPFSSQLEYARNLYEDENACGADVKNCIIRLNRLAKSLELSTDLIISSADELIEFSKSVNSGDSFDGLSVVLSCDIDLDGVEGILPIGTSETPFKGTFDGQDNSIINMTVSAGENQPCGLFGYLDEKGCIKNVNVTDATLSTSGDIGGICVYNNGTIENCSFSGTLTAAGESQGCIGMISAISQGNILDCTALGNITAYDGYTGGIAGHIQSGKVFGCQSLANIQSQNGVVGGLVGVGNEVEITDCAFTGDVSSNSQASGIVGKVLSGNINNCYNTGTVTAPTAGGIALLDNSQSGENNGGSESDDDNSEDEENDPDAGEDESEGDDAEEDENDDSEDTSNDADNNNPELNPDDPTIDIDNNNSEDSIAQSENDSTEPHYSKISIVNCYSAAQLQGDICYPIAPNDALLQNCYYVSDEQLEGSMTAEQMKSRRFAYALNQGVREGWTLWTHNMEQNNGYPIFAEDGNAVTIKPCTVILDAGQGGEQQIYTDIDTGTIIELPQLESTTNEVFFGWSDGIEIFTDEYTATEDITITAIFKKPVSVEIKDAPQQVPLGQDLNLENNIVFVTFEDETIAEYPATLCRLEFEAFSMGEYTATLDFYGATCQLPIKVVAPESQSTVSIGTATAQVGETVEIPIILSGCPNVYSVAFTIDFDTTSISLIEVKSDKGDVFSWEREAGKYVLSLQSNKPIDPNGVLTILKFKVFGSIQSGNYPINVNYDTRNMVDESGNTVLFAVQNGHISATRTTPGDVNNDGLVNLLDGVMLCRYLDDTFEDVVINKEAADLDENNIVDENDLELLREMLTN